MGDSFYRRIDRFCWISVYGINRSQRTEDRKPTTKDRRGHVRKSKAVGREAERVPRQYKVRYMMEEQTLIEGVYTLQEKIGVSND